MLTNMQSSVSGYVVPIRKLKDKLLFESKIAEKEQKRDIAEGDAYKSIKEAWVAAISGTSFGEISREFPRAMSKKTYTTISRAVEKVK